MFHRTEFQKKILSFTWGRKAKQGHWFITDSAPKIIKPPNMDVAVTLKRAAYAAFFKAIPVDIELRSGCGHDSCICPVHQVLLKARSSANGLVLPDVQVAAGGYQAIVRYEREIRNPGRFSDTITAEVAAKVKVLMRMNSIEAVSIMVGLSAFDIMRINNGAFDRAIAGERRKKPTKGANSNDEELEAEEKVASAAAGAVDQASEEDPEPPEDSGCGVSEDELAWLKTVS